MLDSEKWWQTLVKDMVLVYGEPVAISIGFRVKKRYIKSSSWWNTIHIK